MIPGMYYTDIAQLKNEKKWKIKSNQSAKIFCNVGAVVLVFFIQFNIYTIYRYLYCCWPAILAEKKKTEAVNGIISSLIDILT